MSDERNGVVEKMVGDESLEIDNELVNEVNDQ
jgi:hypothetical protein